MPNRLPNLLFNSLVQPRIVVAILKYFVLFAGKIRINRIYFQATNLHPEVDECAGLTKDALQELVATLENISTQSGFVSSVVDNLTRAMTRLSDQRASLIICEGDSYVDYQTRMVECAKDVAKIASEMVF